MFKRFKKRYYQLTLASEPYVVMEFGSGTFFNFDIVIQIRGKITRERLLEHLSKNQDENIQKTLKEFPVLVAWSEIDAV